MRGVETLGNGKVRQRCVGQWHSEVKCWQRKVRRGHIEHRRSCDRFRGGNARMSFVKALFG